VDRLVVERHNPTVEHADRLSLGTRPVERHEPPSEQRVESHRHPVAAEPIGSDESSERVVTCMPLRTYSQRRKTSLVADRCVSEPTRGGSMSETHTDQAPEDPAQQPTRSGRLQTNPVAWLAAAVAVLALVIVGVGGVAFGRSTNNTPPVASTATITVTGSGTVQGTPDTCSFSIGVDTVRPTAVLALAANNTRMKAIERVLHDSGIPWSDLQTVNLSIYEQTNSNGVVTGWDVNDTLNVTDHNIARAGAVIDAAAHAAGNGISFGGVSFSLSNKSSLLATARRQAMQNAEAEASQLAAGANASVTGIVKVTDQENTSPSYPPIPFFGAVANATASVPLRAGHQPVSVTVTVVYSLS
jgi:uncharacterized protein YggE